MVRVEIIDFVKHRINQRLTLKFRKEYFTLTAKSTNPFLLRYNPRLVVVPKSTFVFIVCESFNNVVDTGQCMCGWSFLFSIDLTVTIFKWSKRNSQRNHKVVEPTKIAGFSQDNTK